MRHCPNQKTTQKRNPLTRNNRSAGVFSIVESKTRLEEKTGLCLTSSFSRTDSKESLYLSALNLQTNEITLPRNSNVVYFEFFSQQQLETLIPIDPQILPLTKFKNPDDFEQKINQFMKNEDFIANYQPPRSKLDYKAFWFPTPEIREKPSALKYVEKNIYTELQKLPELDRINRHNNNEHHDQFLQRFKWKKSILKAEGKQLVEKYCLNFLIFLQNTDLMLVLILKSP